MNFNQVWQEVVTEVKDATMIPDAEDPDEFLDEYNEQPFSLFKVFAESDKPLYLWVKGDGQYIDIQINRTNPPDPYDGYITNMVYGDFFYDLNKIKEDLWSAVTEALKPPVKRTKPTIEELIDQLSAKGMSTEEIRAYLPNDLSKGIAAESARVFRKH